METKRQRVSINFIVLWIVLTAMGAAFDGFLGVIIGEKLGFAVGDFVASAISESFIALSWHSIANIAENLIPSTVAGFFNGSFGSIGVAIAQWIILRQYIVKAGWWVPAVIGWGAFSASLSSAINGIVGLLVGNSVYTLLLIAVLLSPIIGFGIGVLQWLILRTQLSQAKWWPLATAIAQSLSTFVSITFTFIALLIAQDVVRYFCNTGIGLLAGGLSGLIEGIALYWLFTRSTVPNSLDS